MKNYYKQIVVKKNVLLLQGPVGPLFRYFANHLIENGSIVHKINFHYGEQIFYSGANTFLYKGSVNQWEEYFSEKVSSLNIQQIFLIGTNKIYHKIAIEHCKKYNIEVYVFEEGYIRSNYITVEQNGVNGDTQIPKDPHEFHSWREQDYIEPPESITLNVVARYFNHFRFYYFYSLGLFISQWLVPKYQHHIPAKGMRIFFKWHRFFFNVAIATIFPFKKENNSKWITANAEKFYIAVLQINTDSAIKSYSQYNHIEEFISETIQSFARNAPPETKLLIKHHPYDRGIHCYKKHIKNLSKQFQVAERVHYIIDAHMDLALECSRGCVLINSTTGFAALTHGVPSIALSQQAIYNMPGLTNGCTLDEFWSSPQPPDMNLFKKFKSYLIYHTQMRGCFYGGTIADFKRKFIFEKKSPIQK